MAFLDNVGLAKFLENLKKKFLLTETQSLTDSQKEQIRINLGISGSEDSKTDLVVAIQQITDFYNGYTGEELNYQEYLTLTGLDVKTLLKEFESNYWGTE